MVQYKAKSQGRPSIGTPLTVGRQHILRLEQKTVSFVVIRCLEKAAAFISRQIK